MNVQARIQQTTGKIQKYYQDTDTMVVPLPPTIIVKCTECGGVKRLPVTPEVLPYYTYNGDQTYTAPWKLCTDCAESNRSDRIMNAGEFVMLGLFVVFMMVLCICILVGFHGPIGG